MVDYRVEVLFTVPGCVSWIWCEKKVPDCKSGFYLNNAGVTVENLTQYPELLFYFNKIALALFGF
jgi:hypothetical protein